MSGITPAHVREVADAVARAELWAVKEAARILRNCARAMERCAKPVYSEPGLDDEQYAYDSGRNNEREEILSILRSTEG